MNEVMSTCNGARMLRFSGLSEHITEGAILQKVLSARDRFFVRAQSPQLYIWCNK